MTDLNLGVIGNCSFGALVDGVGRIVWACMPRFDSDPVFCALLDQGNEGAARGVYALALENQVRSEQEYLKNTAILITRLYDDNGAAIEITDFAPRFHQHGRSYRPTMIVRTVRSIAGLPRIRVVLRPAVDYGAARPAITRGGNHVRYVGAELTLRLTTDAPIAYVLDETPFLLEESLGFILGPDETFPRAVSGGCRWLFENTAAYWREWVRLMTVPLEWQDAVIRAAITLKLSSFEETGAIVAAMTTSIPEVANSGRNWDYRYCWLRDAFFVVRALNRLGVVSMMENYLRYVLNILVTSHDGHLQPVYGIALESHLTEREVTSLPGYRGMGPVRVGNQAFEHVQNDVYGHVILAATQAFFDERLLRPAGIDDFHRLERAGDRAYELHDQPDAGMWELRTRSHVHTSSSVMCWAALDRLSKIADHIGLQERASHWSERAQTVRRTILHKAWNEDRQSFVESFGGGGVDGGLLLISDVGLLPATDERFKATVALAEQELRRGNHLMRYVAEDDLGRPKNAFNICTFWYIDALVALERVDEAREVFEGMLLARNHLGLLSEDTDPDTREAWGNFPQTYSLVGIINSAMSLSKGWESVL